MSARAVIDLLRFAKAGEELVGAVAVAELPRLADRLASPGGEVRYRLTGVANQGGRPALRLQVEAELELTCQRCLEPFGYPLDAMTTLLLARNEAELAAWEQLDPLCDGLVAEPRADVLALVEDEVLLSLPVAPRHPEGGCRPAGMPKDIGFL